jgi:hypothetical protein
MSGPVGRQPFVVVMSGGGFLGLEGEPTTTVQPIEFTDCGATVTNQTLTSLGAGTPDVSGIMRGCL